MQSEYEDGLETLGRREMVFYKFLSLFRAKGTEISYGGMFTHSNADPEIVDEADAFAALEELATGGEDAPDAPPAG
jgi:hypothetical protein